MPAEVVPFLMFEGCAAEAAQTNANIFEGGEILMPLDRYPFSACYGWVSDRLGVFWQIGVSGAA